jgi:hypothetical protein
MERLFDDEAREILGPRRYEVYRNSRDSRYAEAQAFAQRYDLSEEQLQSLYQCRAGAEQAARQLQPTDDPAAEQSRRAELEQLVQQTQNALKAQLGPEIYREYERYARDWLETLPQVEAR